MTAFNANNTSAVDKKVMDKYGIHMVDNRASVPYTDVVLDCSGSMDADIEGMSRIEFSMNLLKVLYHQGHVTEDTLIHGFSAKYRGCVPLITILEEPIYYPDSNIVKSLFRAGGGTTPGAALNHVTNINKTLAIMDMWSEGDLKSSLTTPYDCIFYGVPTQ